MFAAILTHEGAAKILRERFCAASDSVHSHHCLWCLYLAGLVCWNFGFAITGTVDTEELVCNGRVTSRKLAKEKCDIYLRSIIGDGDLPRDARYHWRTAGMLIVLIDFLRAQCCGGLIEEGVELLIRIAGLKADILDL